MFEPVQAFSRTQNLTNESTAIFFRKVYGWMTIGLFLTGIVAMLTASSETLINAIFGTPLFWVVIIGQFGLVMWLSARLTSMSSQTATLAFLGYSVLSGVTFASIFLVYTGTSIAQVFFITGGTFGAMSLWGMVTKKDLSKLGQLAFAALIGLVIASLVNLFLQNSAIYWITSYAGVLIFMVLTAWDTQKLKELSLSVDASTSLGHNVAIGGALMLYLDFINMFLFLLRIFGNRRD
ncbi:Bax inhibitor-1/YccA family protein [bacterium]|nr:Bax inhibitor-1/YccA family protein [bacterium]